MKAKEIRWIRYRQVFTLSNVDIIRFSKHITTIKMIANSETAAKKKREKIQQHFWNEVGSVEHINLPKLEDVIKKEFNNKDDRLIQAQIKLMKTEARIRVQNKVKVWIRQPSSS